MLIVQMQMEMVMQMGIALQFLPWFRVTTECGRALNF